MFVRSSDRQDSLQLATCNFPFLVTDLMDYTVTVLVTAHLISSHFISFIPHTAKHTPQHESMRGVWTCFFHWICPLDTMNEWWEIEWDREWETVTLQWLNSNRNSEWSNRTDNIWLSVFMHVYIRSRSDRQTSIADSVWHTAAVTHTHITHYRLNWHNESTQSTRNKRGLVLWIN